MKKSQKSPKSRTSRDARTMLPELTALVLITSTAYPGVLDTTTVPFGWDDGTAIDGLVEPGEAGLASGRFPYDTAATEPAEADLTDDGQAGDAPVRSPIGDFEPESLDGSLDFSSWRPESYGSGFTDSRWRVLDGGTTVLQTADSKPAILFGEVPVLGRRITGKMSVRSSAGNRYIGLVLGYRSGDISSPDANFVLIDWRQETEGTSVAGLAAWHITGPNTCLWDHSGSDIEELARASTEGQRGWTDFEEYELTVELTEDRLRVWIDQGLEFDVNGQFDGGSLGFYAYGQQQTRFRDFRVEGAVHDESQIAELETGCTDAESDSLRAAKFQWSDRALPHPSPLPPPTGREELDPERLYPILPPLPALAGGEGAGAGNGPGSQFPLTPGGEGWGEGLAP